MTLCEQVVPESGDNGRLRCCGKPSGHDGAHGPYEAFLCPECGEQMAAILFEGELSAVCPHVECTYGGER